MWVHTTTWSGAIAAHPERPDLLVAGFHTQADTDAFIKSIDRFVGIDDLEQRKAFIYGKAPGVSEYPYKINMRREYVQLIMYYEMLGLDYDEFKKAVEESAPLSMKSMLRAAHIGRMDISGVEYGNEVWNRGEHESGKAAPKPVYEPKERI